MLVAGLSRANVKQSFFGLPPLKVMQDFVVLRLKKVASTQQKTISKKTKNKKKKC